MLAPIEWVASGVAATLVCALVMERIGLIQISWMQKAHELNVKRATPRINSRVNLRKFQLPGREDVTRYSIDTKIYNDGDLVARHLEGEWKLTATHQIAKATKVIREGSLPAFLPLELKHEIEGKVSSLWCEPTILLQVNIDLRYIGIDETPQKYHATYEYDFENRIMVQRK